jgi:hypothetical protein
MEPLCSDELLDIDMYKKTSHCHCGALLAVRSFECACAALIERASVVPIVNAGSMLVGEVCFSDGKKDLQSRG